MAKQLKVMIVEDETAWQETLRNVLEGEGYLVETVDTHGQALERLEKTMFDLVVIDLLSSGDEESRNGVALLNGVRLFNRVTDQDIPLIVVTGFSTTEQARKAFQEFNAVDFISKADFDPQAFRQVVKEAINKRATQRKGEQKKLDEETKKRLQELRRKLFRGEIISFGD